MNSRLNKIGAILVVLILAVGFNVFAQETYVLIAPHIGIQYWQVHKAGLEAAAKELGVKTVFTGVMGDSIEDQVKIMDQQVANKPAGILLGPLNAAALTPSINRAIKAGIPVITVDTDAEDSNRLCYIGTNGYAAGQMAADIMAKLLNSEGDVGISNLVGFSTCEERAQGFRDQIKAKYPKMKVIAEVDDKADEEIATKANTEMLIANPSIKGVFGDDAVSPIGMGAAVKSVNKVGKVKLVGFDPMPQTLAMIKQGVIESTMVQRTFAMSYYGLKMLYDFNHGRLELVKGWNVPAAQKAGINTLPKRIDTGIMVVDKTNYTFFQEK
ncbi:MAG: substrate-binding domain-containing protein [Spirochaetia bacterium]|jgi:ribose transport system substrate-binding protein